MNVWIIIVIIILFVLGKMYISYKVDQEYSRIESETVNTHAKNYIWYSKKKINKKAIDYYRMGCIYDHVYKDGPRASDMYNEAVNRINVNNPQRDDEFVMDRIVDRLQLNAIIEDDEVQVPAFPLKKEPISMEVTWTTDNQNVHHTTIADCSVRIFQDIVNRVEYPYSLDTCVDILNNVSLPAGERKNRETTRKVLNHMNEYNPMIKKLNMREIDIFRIIVTDIAINYNPQRKQVLFENLFTNLNDAYSGGNIVCIDGRLTRMLNTFNDGENHVYRTKQVVKNELLEKGAKERDEAIAALSEEDQKKYNADDPAVTESIRFRVRAKLMEVPEWDKFNDVISQISDNI